MNGAAGAAAEGVEGAAGAEGAALRVASHFKNEGIYRFAPPILMDL